MYYIQQTFSFTPDSCVPGVQCGLYDGDGLPPLILLFILLAVMAGLGTILLFFFVITPHA